MARDDAEGKKSVSSKMTIQGVDVGVKKFNNDDYISLTDMLRAKDGEYFVHDWLKNRNTLEYIGIWEKINNPNFNYVEFDTIKSKAGLNRFRTSAQELVEKANIISLIATTGRYGGTYAHKDLAMEFGMWISPEFKIYLVKEFQRLKENQTKQLQWSVRRELSKLNYHIHTDAIKNHLIVPTLTPNQVGYTYANEADMLNVALFGKTAAQWRDENPKEQGNIRDFANIHQLLVLSNMESYNATLIKDGLQMSDRLVKLNELARHQLPLLIQASAPVLLDNKGEK